MSAIINVNRPFVYVKSSKVGANRGENYERRGIAKKSLGVIFKYTNIYGIEVEKKINYVSKKEHSLIIELLTNSKIAA
jgi:hypothetical protein